MKKLSYITMIFCLLFVLSCKKSTYQGNGSVVFYTSSNSHGKITLTVDNATFILPVTTNPDSYCTNGWTGYVLLDVGTYKYQASAADGTKWNGQVEITKGNCMQKLLN